MSLLYAMSVVKYNRIYE